MYLVLIYSTSSKSIQLGLECEASTIVPQKLNKYEAHRNPENAKTGALSRQETYETEPFGFLIEPNWRRLSFFPEGKAIFKNQIHLFLIWRKNIGCLRTDCWGRKWTAQRVLYRKVLAKQQRSSNPGTDELVSQTSSTHHFLKWPQIPLASFHCIQRGRNNTPRKMNPSYARALNTSFAEVQLIRSFDDFEEIEFAQQMKKKKGNFNKLQFKDEF